MCVWIFWIGSLAYGGWKRDAENQLFAPDHIAFYTAAKLIRDGQQAQIYNFEVVGNTQQEIVGGNWPNLMAYRNPPFYALLYLPTTFLTFPLSALVWTVISIAAFAFSIACLKPDHYWYTLGRAATFYPCYATVSFGQNTMLSMAIFSAVYRLLAIQRNFVAGLVAGLLWYKPQLLLGLFTWWGLSPRRHLGCWLGVTASGILLATICWISLPGASWAFVDSLSSIAGYGGENGWNLHSPKAFLALLVGGQSRGVLAAAAVCSLVGIAVGAKIAYRTGAPLAVMFPVAVGITLWASPHTLIYEWALLVPAAVVVWERLPSRRDAWLVLICSTWGVFEISTMLAKFQIDARSPVVVQVSIPALAAIGLLTARQLVTARAGVVVT